MKFVIDETLKMRDFRQAESSNTAAISLMAKFAHDDNGVKMSEAQFVTVVDEMDMAQFYQLYAQFVGASVPNMSGRK